MASIDRRSFVTGSAGLAASLAVPLRADAATAAGIDVLAYYFPAWHQDPAESLRYGAGWTEWKLLRDARPRFPGHQQPKRPAWGEFDEADPRWSAREIALAADNGITGFIYDWYWHGGAPFLQGALEQGFLKSANRDRLKFALMWANHDWLELFPAPPSRERKLLVRGDTDRADFERMTDYVLATYLHQSNYLRVDRGLYFSIYELATFIKAMGGVDGAKAALDSFRAKVERAGLGALHLNAVVWGIEVLPTKNHLADPAAVVHALGVSSLTTYAWVHNYKMELSRFPRDSYPRAAEASYAAWDRYASTFGLPYHPNVSMGWDPSPRTTQGVPFQDYGYPWTSVLEGNTPQAYEAALLRARAWVEARPPAQRVVTLNAWNEWTEGSYLLPDTVTGDAYLRAVKRIFSLRRS